ncbi:hypothetical protein FACS1894177_03400 [Bacteroidia bacterium]|nr:hypothetical protein FACS1894177_03400 [Bacteroidia bacterium]
MRYYHQKKLKDPPKLKDDRNAKINMSDRYTEKKTFFDYFSYRSYISRHRLIVDEKYFALWKNHYPYNQYKSQEKFVNAQEVKQNNTAENNYQEKLKEKVENRILKSSKSFYGICIVFAAAYAFSCLYGICSLTAESDKETKIEHKCNIIGTTQDVIFTYQSSLLEEGQEMEIKVPATMLKYNYKGKHYHANNLQAVYNEKSRDTTSFPTIINPDSLQFYIDQDSLKFLNKTNEYPELKDLEYMLKYKNDSISISIVVNYLKQQNKSRKDTLTISTQTLINSKEQYYSQKETTIFQITKTTQNTVALLLDLLTTILLLFSYNNLSNTTTQEHKQHKNWSIIVLLTFCLILFLLDIYVAKMLVEDKYIFAHWIIDSIASLFAAMTIASFASRMYPQYRKNNLTKNKLSFIFVFFMIYVYACVNILDPFVKEEIINVDLKNLELISKIMAIVRFAGVSLLYFVMFSFFEKRNMNMFFIHEINNLRTMEKENIGFKELHLLMHNKDREEELLDKDKAGEKDELDLLVEMKKREKKLSKLQK